MRMVRQILLAVCLVFFATASFAELKLKQPAGLAVDAAGNLYVANYGLNEILVYDAKYSQVVSKTITQNISGPQAVAIDPYGNVWVANFTGNANGASGYITEYTGTVQDTDATINSSIVGPLYLAFDGLGNLWVLDDGEAVTIYSPTFAWGPPSFLVQNISASLNTLTVSGTVLVSGTDSETFINSASQLIRGAGTIGSEDTFADSGAAAMAPDNRGNTYVSDTAGNVQIVTPDNVEREFVSLGFRPRGIAVDNKNKRLYASNQTLKEIVVYSTVTGDLLKTLHN